MFIKIWNSFVEMVLCSPFYKLLNHSLTLLIVKGRKSGNTYVIPVGYYQSDRQHLTIFTHPERAWWKNLKGGTEVTLQLGGEPQQAHAVAIEDTAQIAEALIRYRHIAPERAAQNAPKWILIRATLH